MSPHDPGDDLDASTEEWIRGLLADARVEPGAEEGMPADVRSRLDDVLAGLRPSQAAGAGPATVVPLHRRWAPRLVAAAAAVLVLGGGGYVASQVTHGGGSDAESTTAAQTATSGSTPTKDSVQHSFESPTSSPPPARAEPGDSATFGAGVPGQAQELTRQLEDAPVISADDTRADVFVLGAQVAHGQRLSYYAEHAAPALNGTSPLTDAVTQGLFGDTYATKDNTAAPQVQDAGGSGCAGPSVTDSVSLRVRYDGGLAVVVLHAPPDAPQDASGNPTALSAELWTCDGSKTLVSTPVS